MRLLVSTLVLSLSLWGAPQLAHADEAIPAGARLTDNTDARVSPPNRKLRREIGLGLVIGAAALAVIGFGLVGGAAQANKNVFAGNVYHPGQETRRDHFEIGDAVLFSAAAVAFIPGMVLIWDR